MACNPWQISRGIGVGYARSMMSGSLLARPKTTPAKLLSGSLSVMMRVSIGLVIGIIVHRHAMASNVSSDGLSANDRAAFVLASLQNSSSPSKTVIQPSSPLQDSYCTILRDSADLGKVRRVPSSTASQVVPSVLAKCFGK